MLTNSWLRAHHMLPFYSGLCFHNAQLWQLFASVVALCFNTAVKWILTHLSFPHPGQEKCFWNCFWATKIRIRGNNKGNCFHGAKIGHMLEVLTVPKPMAQPLPLWLAASLRRHLLVQRYHSMITGHAKKVFCFAFEGNVRGMMILTGSVSAVGQKKKAKRVCHKTHRTNSEVSSTN